MVSTLLVPPRPHASSLHPLHLLDEFLESFGESACTGSSKEDRAEPQRDSADVACQASTCAASEKSLEERRDHVIRVADYLYGGSILEAALAVLDAEGAIRRVCSQPSQRMAFLVRGTSRHSGAVLTDYICLLAASEGGIVYCSCRSYFERAKSDANSLCKHLLALKLMSVLECPCRELNVPDDEFSTIMLKCMLPRDSD
jgi:predicted nucleic acid-binding Zn finger protein